MLRSVLWIALVAAPAAADPGQLGSDSFPVDAPTGTLSLSGGLVTGFPPGLSTGLARGVGAAVTVAPGPVRFGVRAAWITATEYGPAWEVTHSDTQVRALIGVEHAAGRGRVGLRLGAGGSLIHETRLRAQGMRAGLEGDELQTTAWSFAPAFDLEATVNLGIFGPWQLALAGGPSLVVLDGEVRGTWVGMIGVGWQP